MYASSASFASRGAPGAAIRPPSTITASCDLSASPTRRPRASVTGNPLCVVAARTRRTSPIASFARTHVGAPSPAMMSLAVRAANSAGGSPCTNAIVSLFRPRSAWYTPCAWNHPETKLLTTTAKMTTKTNAPPPVPSIMITTSEMLDRNTPPSVAVAPIRAYTPGWTSQVAGSAALNARPSAPPRHAPEKILGMKMPPGTAVPYAAIIMSKYANQAPNKPPAVNPYDAAPQGCASVPMDNIHPIARFGEEKNKVATSLIAPGSRQRKRTPNSSSAAHAAGRETHRPRKRDAANRATIVRMETRAHSRTRITRRWGFGRTPILANTAPAWLKTTPEKPAHAAATTKKGVWCTKSRGVVGRTPPKNNIPALPRLSIIARVRLAAAAQMNERHITRRDQCVLASSRLNKTPPMGAPNAAARPAAAPAETNSRCVASDARSNRTERNRRREPTRAEKESANERRRLSHHGKGEEGFRGERRRPSRTDRERFDAADASPFAADAAPFAKPSASRTPSPPPPPPPSSSSSSPSPPFPVPVTSGRHIFGAARVTPAATAAPTCTMGPSGPTASELPTAQTTPSVFATRALHSSTPGTFVPLR